MIILQTGLTKSRSPASNTDDQSLGRLLATRMDQFPVDCWRPGGTSSQLPDGDPKGIELGRLLANPVACWRPRDSEPDASWRPGGGEKREQPFIMVLWTGDNETMKRWDLIFSRFVVLSEVIC